MLLTMAAFAQTAREVLDKTAAALSNKGGVTANFSIRNGVSGSIKIKGRKFQATTPQGIVWFDGKTQWTYVKQNNEVNVRIALFWIVFSPVMYGCDNAKPVGKKILLYILLNDSDFFVHGQFIRKRGGVAHCRLGIRAVLMAFNLVAQVLKVIILRRGPVWQKDTVVEDVATAPIIGLFKIWVMEPQAGNVIEPLRHRTSCGFPIATADSIRFEVIICHVLPPAF